MISIYNYSYSYVDDSVVLSVDNVSIVAYDPEHKVEKIGTGGFCVVLDLSTKGKRPCLYVRKCN